MIARRQRGVARIACLSGPRQRQEGLAEPSCGFATPIASYRGYPLFRAGRNVQRDSAMNDAGQRTGIELQQEQEMLGGSVGWHSTRGRAEAASAKAGGVALHDVPAGGGQIDANGRRVRFVARHRLPVVHRTDGKPVRGNETGLDGKVPARPGNGRAGGRQRQPRRGD